MPHDEGPDRDRHRGVSRRSFIGTVGLSAAASSVAHAAEKWAREQGERPTDADGAAIAGPDPVPATLKVNGESRKVTIDPATTLLEALRLHLGLTGPKEICDRGACGGCSVIADGRLIASCMMLAIDAQGREITTVEGLAKGDALDPVQEAFVRHDALQCGYCTPGFIVASRALLNQNSKPTLEEIKRGLSGNICRCGTYSNIFNAVLEASGQAPVMDSASIPKGA